MKQQALIVVDHGSKVRAANESVHLLVSLIQAARPNLIIKGAHMELASPNISEAVASSIAGGATEITVHPYMLSPGRHATKDIPAIVRLLETRYPQVIFHVTEPLGAHEKIAEVVLERSGL